ncbi:MAG: class I SAM-dependent methyltransferase [Dehalococcoidia bacterium]
MSDLDLSSAASTFVRTGSLDFGKTAADYARHRAGFPPELFDRLVAGFGIGLPGQRCLDLGTGTGTVARQLAQRGCTVTALDVAEALMDQARLLDAEAGVTVDYRVASAEETDLPAASFDVVTAGQCWHWFDPARATAEVRRVLVPGGRLVICSFDWLPLPGNVVEASEALIVAHNPAWKLAGGLGIHPRFARDIAVGGFRGIETFSFDLEVPYSHEAWRGRIRASAGISASLSPEAVAAFDAEHAAMLRERFPAEPLLALHRVWALVCSAG